MADTQRVPLDGIAPPTSSATAVTKAEGPPTPPVAKKKTQMNVPALLYGVAAVLYVVPALGLISYFPRPDASMAAARDTAIAIYAVGAMLWALFGLIGFLRIASYKDRPRIQLMGMIRLFLLVIPMLLVSGAVMALISREPPLILDIVRSKTADVLIAPVAVTFTTDTTAKVFAAQNLKPAKYSWDFNGDGSIDQESFESHGTYVYQRDGSYLVSVRVTMLSGVVKVVSSRLFIPQSSFGVEPSSPIVDEAALFTLQNIVATADSVEKVQWDFDGDGTVDLEDKNLTASYTYHTIGIVKPSVLVSFTNKTQRNLTRTLEVVRPPVQPFPVELTTEPSTLIGPAPLAVIFVLKTTEPIASASWNFGDQKVAEGLRVTNIYDKVGTYTASVAIHSQSGAVARLQKVVRVTQELSLPDLTFDGSPTVQGAKIEGEIPLSLNITPSTSKPLVTFTWDAPDASEVRSVDKTIQATYRKEGKYQLDLIAMDSEQRVMRKSFTVNVLPPSPHVVFSMDPQAPTTPAIVKFDSAETYIPDDAQITGFEWDFGDGTSEHAGSRIEHLYDKPGTYTISLNVLTTKGESYSGRQTLVVRAPVIDTCFTPSRRTGRAPLGVRFDSSCSTGEFTSWLWDFGDDSQSDLQNPTHAFQAPGDYTVRLTATTKDGRKGTTQTTISVSQ